jgi:hypothetical protein
MKIVQSDDIPLVRGLEHRGGMFHSRRLLEGEPGTLGNFQLTLGITGGDFYSPRHRHNFEQFRCQIEGTLDFARDGKMRPGMVGYFPEGVPYGPQSQEPDEKPLTAVLQFGGPSGSGYLSAAEVAAGRDELMKIGVFKDGVFRRNDDVAGRRNTDGYQAIWEHVHGQPMRYPKGRYEKPVFMDAANFTWMPAADEPGVAERLLGVFTERRTAAAFLRLEAGAAHAATGDGIYLVISGSGRAGEQPYRRFTAVHLRRGETLRFAADAPSVLLHYTLPDLTGLRAAGADEGITAEAAE